MLPNRNANQHSDNESERIPKRNRRRPSTFKQRMKGGKLKPNRRRSSVYKMKNPRRQSITQRFNRWLQVVLQLISQIEQAVMTDTATIFFAVRSDIDMVRWLERKLGSLIRLEPWRPASSESPVFEHRGRSIEWLITKYGKNPGFPSAWKRLLAALQYKHQFMSADIRKENSILIEAWRGLAPMPRSRNPAEVLAESSLFPDYGGHAPFKNLLLSFFDTIGKQQEHSLEPCGTKGHLTFLFSFFSLTPCSLSKRCPAKSSYYTRNLHSALAL